MYLAAPGGSFRLRNCVHRWRLRFAYERPSLLMNELMQQKLRGEDADQRHVVFLADGPPTHELLGQSSDRRGLEDSVVLDLLFAQHVAEIFGGGRKKTLAVGS